MNADPSQLLEQLRDIHSAGQPGWWPPAPGWWMLALLFLLAFAYLLRALKRKLAVHSRRKAWLRELDELGRSHDPSQQPHEYLAAINRVFRAVALRAFPETPCARLQGEAWVAWIRNMLPERIESECLDALASGPYQAVPTFDSDALGEIARDWVRRYG